MTSISTLSSCPPVNPVSAGGVLDALVGASQVRWEEQCNLAAALAVRQSRAALTLVDAIAIEVALRHDCPLLTFDRDQEKTWKTLVKV